MIMTSSEQTRSDASRPVIAVTSRWRQSQSDGWPGPYLTALAAAGGEGTVLDMDRPPAALAGEAMACSGVLLSGGGDVDPGLYGEHDEHCHSVNAGRDEREQAVILAALAANKPILAICRGIQMLNVALGGSLVQDIPSLVPGATAHRRTYDRTELAHTVRLLSGSLLTRCLAAEAVSTNSLHHQCVSRLGDGLNAVGWSSDGLIEALEMPAKRFVVAVQWHPEELLDVDAHARHLFACFLAACSPAGGAQ